MRICITAGGTLEKIDDVRNIKNSSTGRLGQIIADMIPCEHEVDYVHGVGVMLPKRDVFLHPIESVQDLDKMMARLLAENKYDAVIFAMAVSDYMIQTVTTFEKIEETLRHQENISKALYDYGEDLDRHAKIRSEHDNLAVFMVKAPKVISKVKKLAPDAILIGFKLLVDTSEASLIQEAQKVIQKSQADFVLANDLKHIQGDQHLGHLIDASGLLKTMTTKQEIAQEILERLKII